MRYQTTNPRAIANPLASIPLFRAASVLGEQFARQHNAAGFERQVAVRAVQLARFALQDAELAYAAACADLGTLNRRRAKNRHDRGITSDRTVARMVRDAFGTLNRRRGALARARKALAVAEAAIAKLAH